MNKLIRGIITGSVIGAAVGVAMLVKNKPSMAKKMMFQPEKASGTVKMVKDNAMRWTSAVKSGTEAFSRKLAHRT